MSLYSFYFSQATSSWPKKEKQRQEGIIQDSLARGQTVLEFAHLLAEF